MKRLRSNQAKLGYASILIQVANFLVLLIAKAMLPVEDFAFLLTQLAIAGIVGAVATMRFEILVYQQFGKMTLAALALPILAACIVIVLTFLGSNVLFIIGASQNALAIASIPMMLGLALSTAQSFLFIQVNRINLLLAARCCQALALGVMTVLMVLDYLSLSGLTVLLVSGICYLAPAVFWIVCFVFAFEREKDEPPVFFLPKLEMLKRSLKLSLATGVNSVYVNLPLLAAAATQSASFVADFGLILKCFTAPVTFIRQVFGQLFLADAIKWSIGKERKKRKLLRLVTNTMLQSVGAYLIIAPLLATLLYFNLEQLKISNVVIIPFLALAALGQCAINPVSQVRIPLSDEGAFLTFDCVRLVFLMIGLFFFSAVVPYHWAFTSTALALYLSYVAFIWTRISRHSE